MNKVEARVGPIKGTKEGASVDELDHGRIKTLLKPVAAFYPDAGEWLGKTLKEIEAGDADAVGFTNYSGICIGKLKDSGKYKICTLYVAPHARRKKQATLLLRDILEEAERREASVAYITVPASLRVQYGKLLRRAGFRRVSTEFNRYGFGRHEDVFELVLPKT